MIEGFITGQADKNAYEIGVDIIRQSGIMNDVCQDTSPENLSRKENIEELVNGMNDFCALRQEEGNPNISLTDFLSEIALLTAVSYTHLDVYKRQSIPPYRFCAHLPVPYGRSH